MISLDSTVVAIKDQASSNLTAEVVILNLKSGMYYGLKDAGARIWDLLQEPRTLREVRDALLEEYEVDRDRCGSDVLKLVEKLVSEKLVEVKDEQGS